MSAATSTIRNRLLVTGGAGFIGSNFIHYWLKQHPEDQIVNLDALTYAGSLTTLQDIAGEANYTFVQGSITNRELVDELMSNSDVVVHFAAETHVDRSIATPEVFLETNVLGTFELVRAALAHNIKRFHHISTDEVFGALELDSAEKFTLESPYQPHSPYAASKASSDHIVRSFGDTYGLPFTLTNCSNNYGEYHFPEKMIPRAITNLMDGEKVPIYGDGLYVRDWLYVQDHCQAIELVLESGQVGETYLVGGMNKDVNNLELTALLLRMMGKDESMLEYVADRPGHDRRYSVDWSYINQKLGWQPSVTLEEGLQKTVDWYQSHQDWWRPLKTEAMVKNRSTLE
jgi:dTDP-glucose 4,6-dehydratase